MLVAIYMMRPALLLALLAPTAAALQQLNRRDALKGTTASVAQIALTPAVAAAASEKLALPKMGIGAWAWGDSLFWGSYLCRNKSLAARSC